MPNIQNIEFRLSHPDQHCFQDKHIKYNLNHLNYNNTVFPGLDQSETYSCIYYRYSLLRLTNNSLLLEGWLEKQE